MADTTNTAGSGSYNFTVDRDTLMKDALVVAGVVDVGYAFDDDTLDFCSRQLNMMIKSWQNDGLQMWRLRRFTLFIIKSQGKYQLGPSGDHAAENWDRSTNSTDVATALTTTGVSTITVDSTSGMTANDYVMVEQNDGTSVWSTISSVDSTTAFTMAGSTTDEVAADNKVYWYTNRIQRPFGILDDAQLYIEANATDTRINKVPYDQYRRLGSKTSEGTASQFAYDKQLTHGELYLFPEHLEVRDTIEFRAQFPFDDMDNATDEFQFDNSWLLAIQYGFAELIAIPFGTDASTFKKISGVAAREKERAMGFDTEEDTYVEMIPSRRASMSYEY